MKNIALAGLLFIAMCSCCFAQKTNGKLITWEATDNHGKTKLTVEGEVTISDDDQRITAISKNGSISFEQKSATLEVTPASDGTLLYRINKKPKTVLDAHDEQLLTSVVEMMISRGINAESRTKRLYTQGGSAAVLQELPKLHGDYARQKYLSALLNLGINSAEMVQLLENSGRYLSSDYYHAELLADVMKTSLMEEATFKAYLAIVRDMKSDYYQYTTLQKLMKATLTTEQTASVVGIVKTMQSDYYQAEVYQDLLKQEAFGGAAFNETLEMVFAMNSDYYKSEIIKNLIKRKLTEDNWAGLIGYASKIGSDYYQSELLLNIADKMPQNEALKKSLNEAAKAIKSEYYYGKLMRKLAAS